MPGLDDTFGSSDGGALSADASSTPVAAEETTFHEAEDGAWEWGSGDGEGEVEEAAPTQEPDLSIGGDADINAALGNALGNVTPQQPQSQEPQFPIDQMPEEFDPALLNRDTVTAYRDRISLHFDQQLLSLGANGQHPAVQAAYQAAKAATLTALDYKSKLTGALAMAYRAYEQQQKMERDLEPSRRLESARLLAKRYNIADPEKLLKHPVTGQPVNDAKSMLIIASMMGEQDRKARVGARRGVDTPVRPAASGGSGKSIQSLDPHGKDFAAIERAVAEGKHVRLLG